MNEFLVVFAAGDEEFRYWVRSTNLSDAIKEATRIAQKYHDDIRLVRVEMT